MVQKKLVYLYLINYAKTNPDLCILAVNTFVQDSEDSNPLIRALAIRTIGCVRVQKMIDYLSEPLRKTLKDESPYVRKTAVTCILKYFDLCPEICVENGFILVLNDMLSDSNASVFSNVVCVLREIQDRAPELQAFELNSNVVKKLLSFLNECSEWGRISILDALASYTPLNQQDSEIIIERVIPQLQHANPAVVMAVVKILFLNLKNINSRANTECS